MRAIETWQLAIPLAASTAILSLIACTAYGSPASNEVRFGKDVFTSGDTVYLNNTIPGDAIAAGGTVRSDAAIRGDALIAGGLVNLNAPVGGDLYAAGRTVEVHANVAGNTRIVGAEVAIAQNTVLDGAVTIAGGTVEVNGTVNQYLQVLAATTHIGGTVLGDVDVSGGELFIDPSANIEGAVTFHGSIPAAVAQGAHLKSPVKYTATEPTPAWGAGVVVALVMLAFGWWLGAALVGTGFWQLWPRTANGVAEATRQQTLRSLGLGAALAILGPPLMVVLGLSVVGLPLALIALGVYVLIFPFGYVVSCSAIAQQAFGSKTKLDWARRLGATFAVLVGASVCTAAIPVLGPLGACGMSMIGVGSLILTWFRSMHHPSPPVNASSPTEPTSPRAAAV